MDHETKEEDFERMPRPDEVVAFDPDEFATAFIFAMNAASGEAHIQDPAEIRLTLTDDDQQTTQLQFLDSPGVRIALALKDRYFDVSPRKYYSALFRIMALMDLLKGGGLEPWVRAAPDGSDRMEMEESVVAAAAVVRLNRKGQFSVRDFMRTVREIEAQMRGPANGL